MTPEQIQQARSHLGRYYLAEHPNYKVVRYQQEFMVPALHKLARHEIPALALCIPPGHAKTDIGTKAFLSWMFGRQPSVSNMLLSYSDKFAKRFGGEILRLMKSEVHKQVFPECRLSPSAHASSYFQTTSGGSFFSAGFNGTITGQRITQGGMLVIDDPIKNKEEASSDAVMSKRIEDYDSAVNSRMEANCGRLMCLTRWGKNDFFDRVIDMEGEAHEGGLWTVLKLPAEAGEHDPLGRQPGEYLWPEFLGNGWYAQRKRRTQTWMALYQQDPQAKLGKFFKKEWLNFYPNPVKPGKFPCYFIVDPSRGEKKHSDRSAMLMFAATPDRHLLLVDGVVGRLNPDERAAECIRLVKKWRPKRWIYEEFGLMTDTWELNKASKAAGINIYPISVGRKGPRHMMPKEDRIQGLVPDFREGILWLPQPDTIPFPAMMTDQGEEISIIEYFIENEYLDYAGDNSVEHDDVLDAMSRLHDPELSLRFPLKEETDTSHELNKQRRFKPRLSWEVSL